MEVKFLTTNLELVPSIRDYLNTKIKGLERYLKRYGSAPLMRVGLSRVSSHHSTGDIFKAELWLKIPSKPLYASAQCSQLKLAIDEAFKELKKQVLKDKTKRLEQRFRPKRV
jgi:ribosomal subunit interface protein